MKFLHLSDLHLGKRVNEFSMLEDQEYILTKIINIIDDEKPEAILLAGDIYDKSVPSAEAVQLFDDFLYRLSKRNLQVFIISGNHDSAERIAFGSRLMDSSGIHMSPVFDGKITPNVLEDEFGKINVYMLPFIKPIHVRRYFQEKDIETYTDALHIVIDSMGIDVNERNIIVTHQFVTGASRSESEEISVGGTDNVDSSVFEGFDYVALGHIHGPQNIGQDQSIRYCGTPLKYSFSEVKHEKSVTCVEIKEKGDLCITTIPLIPKHDMREIKGTYMEVTSKSFYAGTDINDYIRITLTDEEDIPDAIGKLRAIYPNLMKLDYDNKRTQNAGYAEKADEMESKSPFQLFSEFYELQNGQKMSKEQSDFSEQMIRKIWEDRV